MDYKPIKCAALRKNDHIYIGKRHCDCFIQEPKGYLVNAEQGFVTEDGVFVDRRLAFIIADHYGQIREKRITSDFELYSEDLY